MPLNCSTANVLYWNCHCNDNEKSFQQIFFQILKENKVDIFCLDESISDTKEFEDNIKNSLGRYSFVGEGCANGRFGSLRIFSRIAKIHFDPKNVRVSNRFVNFHFKKKFDLCFVHFKSMRFTSQYEKLRADEKTLSEIYGTQKAFEKKFLVGDFNASPYSTSMLNSRILNTVRFGEGLFQIKRCNINNRKRINPSWSFFEENDNGIYGTFANLKTTDDNIGMELFDQVVFDEGLQQFYTPKSFKIISKVGKVDLLDEELKCPYSDHLPIFFQLKNLK